MNNDNPFIDRPDEHSVGAANELYCWMPGNSDRECNGSCVAFGAEGDAPCLALSTLLELGATLKALADLHKRAAVKDRVAAQRAEIDRIPQPPEVL